MCYINEENNGLTTNIIQIYCVRYVIKQENLLFKEQKIGVGANAYSCFCFFEGFLFQRKQSNGILHDPFQEAFLFALLSKKSEQWDFT